eukprot:Gb_24372 [translate_table: standard]
MISRGIMLGLDQPIVLHMLDIPPTSGALMELIDVAFPLLKGVVATTDVVESCTSVNITIMVGRFHKKEGMKRKYVMSKNVSIYKSQALALEQYVVANCKVVFSSFLESSSTHCKILKDLAPSILKKNATCLKRIDHNKALG